MALKKQQFAEGEIAIFDEACIYKRGEYWQFRMWLPKENKYARKSLRTRSEATAVERGKAAYLEIYANLQQGKSYFSIADDTKRHRTNRFHTYSSTATVTKSTRQQR